MKINHLLQQRSALLQQTRLANVAFAFAEIGKIGARISRGRLRGRVTLQLADPQEDRAWPVLVAEEGSQAVLDEHFLDQDILELSDLLRFVSGEDDVRSFTFRLEDLEGRYRPALQKELEAAGVELPGR